MDLKFISQWLKTSNRKLSSNKFNWRTLLFLEYYFSVNKGRCDQNNHVLKYLHRYYQPRELAGGLRLVGGGDNPTGVFAMDFEQPTSYKWKSGAFQANIDFFFKKSVFFADFIIICLGSGITSTNSNSHITQVNQRICLNNVLCFLL